MQPVGTDLPGNTNIRKVNDISKPYSYNMCVPLMKPLSPRINQLGHSHMCVALLYKSLSLNIIERSAVKLCFFFSSPKYFPDFLRKASEILRKAILWWRHLMLLQVFYFLIDKPLQSSSCCLWKRIRVRPGVCFAQNRMPYVYLSFS